MNGICEQIHNEENLPIIEIHEKWEEKRKETFYMQLLFRYSMGLEYTMLLTTLWYYVSREMQSSNSHMFYGLICSGKFIAPIIFGLFISRWFDIHRKLKCCAIFINLMIIAGHILYLIPISPLFPLAGKILQGTSYILNGLMNSELLRAYDKDEIQGQYTVVLFAYGLGETTGVLCVKVFEKIDIWIGGVHIMYGNMPSLLLLGFTIIKLVLTFFFVHDLSLEYDLKANHSGQSESYSRKHLYKLYDILGIDVYILLAEQFFAAFCMALHARIIPLIMQTLHYKYLAVDISFIGVSLIMMFVSFAIKKIKLSSIGVYNCGVLGIALILFIDVALLVIVQNLSDVINYILLTVFIVCFATGWICTKIFNVITIGKLCYSSQQSLVESIRLLVELSAAFLGSLTSAFIYQNLNYCVPLWCILVISLFTAMIIRRKTLTDPKVRDNNIPLMCRIQDNHDNSNPR